MREEIIAFLKQQGQMSFEGITEGLSTFSESELRANLDGLVRDATVKRSPRSMYYVPGHVKLAPRKPPVQRGDIAVDFGVGTPTGRGVRLDGIVYAPGDVFSHNDLSELLGAGGRKGIRRSKRLGCVVIIASGDNRLYRDRWRDGIFMYTGEGRRGAQKMSAGNLAIEDSRRTGVPLLLFFKRKTSEYEFQGEVCLSADPVAEEQPDDDGLMRRVWVFPLKMVES